MSNPYRAEVMLVMNGVPYQARLSLGALAALEKRLDAKGLAALVGRFETKEISARDVIAVIWAGLYGSGTQISYETVADAEIEGGAMKALQIAAELIARAFVWPK